MQLLAPVIDEEKEKALASIKYFYLHHKIYLCCNLVILFFLLLLICLCDECKNQLHQTVYKNKPFGAANFHISKQLPPRQARAANATITHTSIGTAICSTGILKCLIYV